MAFLIVAQHTHFVLSFATGRTKCSWSGLVTDLHIPQSDLVGVGEVGEGGLDVSQLVPQRSILLAHFAGHLHKPCYYTGPLLCTGHSTPRHGASDEPFGRKQGG